MSEEKGNLKGLAISFILISLIMGAGVGIVYFIGQSIYWIGKQLNWHHIGKF